MKEITLQEQKEIEVEILVYIHNICMSNNIKYSLCGGTLLGAVRHKGFIPWDDDIDIIMVRPEYEKLMNILRKDTKYRLFKEGDKGYFYPHAKLVDKRTSLTELHYTPIEGYGVYIDIFPADGLPLDKKELDNHIKKSNKLVYKMWNSTHGDFYYMSHSKLKSMVKFIIKAPFAFYCRYKGIFYWSNKLVEHLRQYPFNTNGIAGFIASVYKERDALPASIYNSYITMDFEGQAVMVMEGWQTYLESLYGDYMKLPPKEKQVSHHNFKAYWKE